MKKIFTLYFIIFSVVSFSQEKYLDFEKYKDCQVSIPIKNTFNKQAEDIKAAKQLAGKELIIISAKKDGKIKSFHRGYIGIYSESDAMATFFEPTESVISFDKKYTVYLLYNSKNTYCYYAKCYDKINGKKEDPDLVCSTQIKKAAQFYGNGMLAIEQRKYDLAIRWLELAIQNDTTFCDAWNSIGIAHEMKGDYEKSYWSYINSLVIDSTNYMSWINLYNIFSLSDDTINAITSLKKLIKNAPDNEFGYNELIKHYKSVNDTISLKEIIITAKKQEINIKQ